MLTAIRKQLYLAMAALRRQYLRSVWGMDIGKGVLISGKAFLDYTHPDNAKALFGRIRTENSLGAEN